MTRKFTISCYSYINIIHFSRGRCHHNLSSTSTQYSDKQAQRDWNSRNRHRNYRINPRSQTVSKFTIRLRRIKNILHAHCSRGCIPIYYDNGMFLGDGTQLYTKNFFHVNIWPSSEFPNSTQLKSTITAKRKPIYLHMTSEIPEVNVLYIVYTPLTKHSLIYDYR